MRRLLLPLSLALSLSPLAASGQIFRCTDAQGRVSFAQQPCERGARQDVIQMKRPAPAAPPVLEAEPAAEPEPERAEDAPAEAEVPTPAAELPPLTIPEAVEQGAVVPGMTQEEVLRALENANRGSSSRRGPDIGVRREGGIERWEFRNAPDGWPSVVQFEQGRVSGAER